MSTLQWQAPSLSGAARQNASKIIDGTCKFPTDTFYGSFPLALLPVKADNTSTNRHVFDVVTSGDKKVKGPIWNDSKAQAVVRFFDSFVASTVDHSFVSLIASLLTFPLIMKLINAVLDRGIGFVTANH